MIPHERSRWLEEVDLDVEVVGLSFSFYIRHAAIRFDAIGELG
jgi:hypothetical protein